MEGHPIANIARKRGRVLTGALLLIALCLHSLIPAGFMPAYGNGKIALTICSGAGTQIVYVDADDAADGHDGAAPSMACPYYLAQALSVPPAPVILSTVGAVSAPHSPVAPPAVMIARDSALPPPLRGPPAVIYA